jgi:hypothetical protein
MNKEIDDLLEIDSNLEINPENSSTAIHILIRFISPYFILGIGCLYTDKFNGGYGELFLFAGLIIFSLLFVFFEIIYFAVNKKTNLAIANLKAFGLIALSLFFIYIIMEFID